MKLHAGQLSLLKTDDPPQDETIKRPKRAERQQATPGDKPAESATSARRGATRGRATSAAAAEKAALLTTNEAAALLHVHPRTVQRLVERGELCTVRLGSAVRFDPDDVAGLIERVKRGPALTDPAGDRGPSLHAVGPSPSFRDRIGSGG